MQTHFDHVIICVKRPSSLRNQNTIDKFSNERVNCSNLNSSTMERFKTFFPTLA